MVYGYGSEGGLDRLFQYQRLHGDQTGRVCALGADSGASGRQIQGDGSRECLYADADSGISFAKRKGSRGRFCTGGSMGDARGHGGAK